MADNQTMPGVEREVGPVVCGRRKRTFAYLVIEEIEGFPQLRVGDVLVPKIDACWLHCGWAFHWNIREKDIQRMTVTYGQVLQRGGYLPE